MSTVLTLCNAGPGPVTLQGLGRLYCRAWTTGTLQGYNTFTYFHRRGRESWKSLAAMDTRACLSQGRRDLDMTDPDMTLPVKLF